MAKIVVEESKILGHINPELQGQFSEHLGRGIYEGIYVRLDSGIENVNGMRTDVVSALKEMGVPLLRWPGGCFADEYHWKDGVGPKENRKKMINTNWGGVLEDNSFGTNEYFELCRQLGCRTYVNANVGSGTVQEMSEWVEYMTFDGVSPMADLRRKNGQDEPWKLDYLGIGNENWGCGGSMTPEYYGNLYRRYQTFCRQYHPDHPFRKIACGPNVDDTDWTNGVLKTCFAKPAGDTMHGFMDLLSLHYYTFPGDWEHKGSASSFDDSVWYETMKKALYAEDLVRMHGNILDTYDPEKKIGISFDEWGGWYDVEPGTNPGFLYQQNTMRDALIAGLTLNIFNRHCDRVKLACIAQMVNVLQSMILTEGEKMVKTPTYHVFHMYKKHQDADLVSADLEENPTVGMEKYPVPALDMSVSVKDGVYTATVANVDLSNAYPVEISFRGFRPKKAEASIVTGDKCAKNTFDDPNAVTEEKAEDATLTEHGCSFEIPACSVMMIQLR